MLKSKKCKYGISALLLLTLVFISGCGQQSTPVTTTSSSATATSSQISITIKDFSFTPATITIKTGSTVTWLNQDSMPHTATATGIFDSGTLNQGDSFNYTFNQTGVFDYHCNFHSQMKGEITVE